MTIIIIGFRPRIFIACKKLPFLAVFFDAGRENLAGDRSKVNRLKKSWQVAIQRRR